jgi:hypothetical protein
VQTILSWLLGVTVLLASASLRASAAEPAGARASFVDSQGKPIQTAKVGEQMALVAEIDGVSKEDLDRLYTQFSVFYVAPPPPPPPGVPAPPSVACEGAASAHSEEHQTYPNADSGKVGDSISVKPAELTPIGSRLRIRMPFTIAASVATCRMPPSETRKLTFDALRLSSPSWTTFKTVKPKQDVSISIP